MRRKTRYRRRYRAISSVELLISDIRDKLYDELLSARTVAGVRKVLRKFADNDTLWKAVQDLSRAQEKLKAVSLK